MEMKNKSNEKCIRNINYRIFGRGEIIADLDSMEINRIMYKFII